VDLPDTYTSTAAGSTRHLGEWRRVAAPCLSAGRNLRPQSSQSLSPMLFASPNDSARCPLHVSSRIATRNRSKQRSAINRVSHRSQTFKCLRREKPVLEFRVLTTSDNSSGPTSEQVTGYLPGNEQRKDCSCEKPTTGSARPRLGVPPHHSALDFRELSWFEPLDHRALWRWNQILAAHDLSRFLVPNVRIPKNPAEDDGSFGLNFSSAAKGALAYERMREGDGPTSPFDANPRPS